MLLLFLAVIVVAAITNAFIAFLVVCRHLPRLSIKFMLTIAIRKLSLILHYFRSSSYDANNNT